MLKIPRIAPKLLTNGAYGAPPFDGPPRSRRMTPTALLCIHITANGRTPPASATAERNNVNDNQPNGPSAHFYADRTGVLVQAIDWREFPAWSNGDVKNPNISIPGVKTVVDLMAKGFNANECYGIEIENVGREPDYPVTDAQVESNAYLAALAKLEWPELPISTATVHGHRYLNTVDKGGCPTRGDLEGFLRRVISLGNDYYEVMALQAEVEDLNAITDARGETIEKLRAQNTTQATTINEQLATIDAQTAYIEELGKAHDAKLAEWIAYRDATRTDAGQLLGRRSPDDGVVTVNLTSGTIG